MAIVTASQQMFLGRLILLALFLLPVGYVGIMMSVTVHEVVGHGGMALLVGGQFDGFVIEPTGGGLAYAYTDADSATWRTVLILLAGGWATMLVGLLLVLCAWRVKHHVWAQLALYGLGMATLLDTYAVWSAWSSIEPGDAAVAVNLTGSQTLRWSIVLMGVIVMIFGAWFPLRGLLANSDAWLSQGRGLSQTQGAIVIGSFVTTMCFAYYGFDWNELAPNVGLLPAHCHAALTVIVGIALYMKWPARQTESSPAKSIVIPMTIAWLSAIVTFLTAELWLSYGVMWV